MRRFWRRHKHEWEAAGETVRELKWGDEGIIAVVHQQCVSSDNLPVAKVCHVRRDVYKRVRWLTWERDGYLGEPKKTEYVTTWEFPVYDY